MKSVQRKKIFILSGENMIWTFRPSVTWKSFGKSTADDQWNINFSSRIYFHLRPIYFHLSFRLVKSSGEEFYADFFSITI